MRLDQVKAGMPLAKDVYDLHGSVLVRAGVCLTDRHLKALKSWGISEIEIRSPKDQTPKAPHDPATIAEVREPLDAHFSMSNTHHPVVQALYEICLERALARR